MDLKQLFRRKKNAKAATPEVPSVELDITPSAPAAPGPRGENPLGKLKSLQLPGLAGKPVVQQLQILGAGLLAVLVFSAGLVWLDNRSTSQGAAYASAAGIGTIFSVNAEVPWQWAVAHTRHETYASMARKILD